MYLQITFAVLFLNHQLRDTAVFGRGKDLRLCRTGKFNEIGIDINNKSYEKYNVSKCLQHSATYAQLCALAKRVPTGIGVTLD
jgi:hypothetical protein